MIPLILYYTASFFKKVEKLLLPSQGNGKNKKALLYYNCFLFKRPNKSPPKIKNCN